MRGVAHPSLPGILATGDIADIADIAGPILDGPMPPPVRFQAGKGGVRWRQAGQPTGERGAFLPGRAGLRPTGARQALPRARKLQPFAASTRAKLALHQRAALQSPRRFARRLFAVFLRGGLR